MDIQKIVTRADGSQIKVRVTLLVDADGFYWTYAVWRPGSFFSPWLRISDSSPATLEEVRALQLQLMELIKP